MFASFHGLNSPNMANFKLPTWSPRRMELGRVTHSRLSRTTPSTPLLFCSLPTPLYTAPIFNSARMIHFPWAICFLSELSSSRARGGHRAHSPHSFWTRMLGQMCGLQVFSPPVCAASLFCGWRPWLCTSFPMHAVPLVLFCFVAFPLALYPRNH